MRRDVADYLSWFENERGASRHTLRGYRGTLERMCELLDKPVEEVTTDDLRRVRDSFKAGPGRAPRTAHLKSFWNWMYEESRVDFDPARRIRYPKTPKEVNIECFTDVEIAQMASLPLEDRALVLLLLSTGIRRAEALALQVRHVDLVQGEVVVVRGKGGKGRIAPIVDEGRTVATLAELIMLEGLNPKDYLWYTRRVTPVTYSGGIAHKTEIRREAQAGDSTFGKWWRRCLEESEVEYRKPHTTRHTYATSRIRNGCPIQNLQKDLGHSSIQTTIDVYGHLTDSDTRAQVERERELLRLRVDTAEIS